jgi:hypothetical protein
MKQVFLFLLAIAMCKPSTIDAEALPEYALKSAYIYNFALLTDWRGTTNDDFSVCFYKKDFGGATDVLSGKMLHAKKVVVHEIASVNEAKNCRIVYIRETEKKDTVFMQQLSSMPVLIISENPDIASHITIVKEKNKLAFDVRINAFEQSDLVVSSRLLKLARKVSQ